MTRAVLLVFLAACGGTGAPETPDAGTCPLPTSATGEAGARVDIVSTDPSPPARFDNTWVITAQTPAGAPAAAADVVPTAYMPAHGHSTPSPPTAEDMGVDDQLRIRGLDLWMPGTWEVRFDVAGDRVTFPVCIPE